MSKDIIESIKIMELDDIIILYYFPSTPNRHTTPRYFSLKGCLNHICYVSFLKKYNTINYIYVPIIYRRRGIATSLLSRVISWCRTNMRFEINLEDCSDYYKQPDNIYTKMGFHYISGTDNDMLLKL